jgi:O-acetyl-ADP-ribose deacetylase (regulator of RNase III)
MIKFIDGDVFNSDADYILHQTNCKGVMGSGIAKTVKEMYPDVFNEYHLLCRDSEWYEVLGSSQIIKVSNKRSIVNIFGQNGYSRMNVDTDYESLSSALKDFYNKLDHNKINKIALPYKMSCDRGGGDWNVVLELIDGILNKDDTEIEIWRLVSDN